MSALQDVQTAAESIARKAGELLLVGAKNVRGGGVHTKTSSMDVVTATDVASEELIVARIRAAFPHDAIIAEEGAARTGSTGRRWIIDPLDGTSNFVRKWDASVVSIGVELEGQFTVGVVYDPFRDELFSATTGMGAFRNSQRLRLRTEKIPIAEAFVGMVGGYKPWAQTERAAVASRILLSVGDLRYTGSAARDFCYLADGRLDACFGNGYCIWDLAAGVGDRTRGRMHRQWTAGGLSTNQRPCGGSHPETDARVPFRCAGRARYHRCSKPERPARLNRFYVKRWP
ncbi:MAG: inositol monophosphatase [Acidimicrobiales bacterium]|nr:MAG: inositol monophosphatase [Acidimicrobiales bacterium]